MKKIITKVGATLSTVATSLAAVPAAFALDSSVTQILGGLQGKGGSLEAFITSALNLVISLSALAAVGILIFSGIMYITAAGDDSKVEKATKGITFAIIGLVICFIAVIVVNFVMRKLLS